jgi:hypothetical protein
MGGKKNQECCLPPTTTICATVGSPALQTTGTTGTAYISFPLTFSQFNFGVNPKLLKGGNVTIVTTASTTVKAGTILDLGTFGTGVIISANGGIAFTIDEANYVAFWQANGLISAPPPTLATGTSLQVSLVFQNPPLQAIY